MDVRQLSALIAVAEGGSFSAAARHLHTVQSNISTHIARLERELRATLVDRSTGELTEEGQVVLERARRIQVELAAIAADVAAIRDQVTGHVRLGCIGTVGRWLVPLVFERMRSEYPSVDLVVVDATTSSLVPQLLSDTLDLAVVNLPLADDDLVTDALFEEDHLFVAPEGHPLAGRSSVHLTELAEHELLLEPVGTSFRDELDAAATAVGVTLRAQSEVDGLRLIATLALQGFGAALVPVTAVPPYFVSSFPISRIPVEGLARRTVGLAARRRALPSAPVRALREVIAKVVADGTLTLEGIHPLGTPR
ncbi:MAG: LysR family transcriptional regulator [Actinomycetota bacterium]